MAGAARDGHNHMIRFLLDNLSFDPDEYRIAAFNACIVGNTKALDMLLEVPEYWARQPDILEMVKLAVFCGGELVRRFLAERGIGLVEDYINVFEYVVSIIDRKAPIETQRIYPYISLLEHRLSRFRDKGVLAKNMRKRKSKSAWTVQKIFKKLKETYEKLEELRKLHSEQNHLPGEKKE